MLEGIAEGLWSSFLLKAGLTLSISQDGEATTFVP